MTSATPDALADRIARLERINRRLVAGGLIAITAGVIGMAARLPAPQAASHVAALTANVLTARTIRMVDDQHRVRAEIGIDADGSAGLFLRDATGRVRSAYVHDDAQTALFMMDAAGAIRVGSALFAHGGGGFALHGDEGKGGAVLYLADRRGTLTFFDEHGAVIERTPAARANAGETP